MVGVAFRVGGEFFVFFGFGFHLGCIHGETGFGDGKELVPCCGDFAFGFLAGLVVARAAAFQVVAQFGVEVLAQPFFHHVVHLGDFLGEVGKAGFVGGELGQLGVAADFAAEGDGQRGVHSVEHGEGTQEAGLGVVVGGFLLEAVLFPRGGFVFGALAGGGDVGLGGFHVFQHAFDVAGFLFEGSPHGVGGGFFDEAGVE